MLRWLAALGAVGLADPGLVLARRKASTRGQTTGREQDHKAAAAGARPGKRLVVVLLQGGPDGLSLAAPTADPFYPALRPTTAIVPGKDSLDLGGGFILHPALAPLFPLWKQKKLAVIPACGLPGVAPEHQAALASFAAGVPAKDAPRKSGWLGRLSLALGGERAQMLVGSLSPVFAGAPHYKLLAPGRGPSLPAPVPEDQALFEAESRLFDGRTALDTAFTAGRKARSALQSRFLAESRESAAGAVPAPTFARYGERFGRELAERRDASLGFVAVSGFDTHVSQGAGQGYLADRLCETAEGLSGLLDGLGKAADGTVVVTLGEFGRRVRENAFGGTDNGRGGVMLVMGGPVAGGRVLGPWPGLADHRLAEGQDVDVATDWRGVVAEIARYHLGLPEKRLAEIFPGFTPQGPPPSVLA
jgi:uncharacterized protein (DUF1501 family)